jgi:hypothetical protein
MAGQSNAVRVAPSDKTPELSPAARRLVMGAPYAAPKVVSFPIDGLRVSGPVALAGNVGGS